MSRYAHPWPTTQDYDRRRSWRCEIKRTWRTYWAPALDSLAVHEAALTACGVFGFGVTVALLVAR